MWVDIRGYEGLYQINPQGQVKRTETGYILKPQTCRKDGYIGVGLSKNGQTKTYLLHRL